MAKKSKMKLPINEVLGVVAGAVAAGFVSKLVNDKLPNTPGFVKSLIPIGVGVFLAGNKNAILKGAGFGMIAKGSASIVEAFGIGQPNVDELFLSEMDMLSSPMDQSILSAPADQSILSAMDEEGINGMEELSMMNAFDEEF